MLLRFDINVIVTSFIGKPFLQYLLNISWCSKRRFVTNRTGRRQAKHGQLKYVAYFHHSHWSSACSLKHAPVKFQWLTISWIRCYLSFLGLLIIVINYSNIIILRDLNWGSWKSISCLWISFVPIPKAFSFMMSSSLSWRKWVEGLFM